MSELEPVGAPAAPRAPTEAAPPRQRRAVETYERLLDMAGELLAEVGIERISTNLICARAGMTPPALCQRYRSVRRRAVATGLKLFCVFFEGGG